MRVLINAASSHMGGSVTYLDNVLPALTQVRDDLELLVVAPSETVERLSSRLHNGIRLKPYPFDRTNGFRRLYFDQVVIPRVARSEKVDVLFSVTGFGTFWSPCPQLLLVRNLAYFDPSFHQKYRELGRSLRTNTLRRWHSIASIRAADVILFPSLGMGEFVGLYVNLPEHRFRAIHYGFDHHGFWDSTDAPAGIDQIQKWKEEGYRILLNVSTYAIHKNLETGISALAHLRAQNVPVKLVTTTSREQTSDLEEYDRLQALIQDEGLADDVLEIGYVSRGQLASLYREADVYVFPSFTESFGHSLVEAMAAGKPICAASTPVNREVCSSAAMYFEPFDAIGCAEAIDRVLGDDEVASMLSLESKGRAAHFSWERYAALLSDLFDEVVVVDGRNESGSSRTI